MQYKLLNRAEGGDSSEGGGKQFQELLGLCRSDLDEILQRLKAVTTGVAAEDELRKELLEQSRKANEARTQQEKQVYEMQNEHRQKIEALHQKWEAEKAKAQGKLKEEIALKNERIKELEKNEKRAMTDKDKCDSYARQIKEA